MKQTKTYAWLVWLIAALFVLLAVLTYTTITLLRYSSSGMNTVPFDLEQITAQQNADEIEISDLILPAFIGITSDNTRRGTSVSVNTAADLYDAVMPVLAECFTDACASEGSDEHWKNAAAEPSSVYIRYHSSLPDYLIHTVSGGSVSADNSAYVYEMFLLPYSESTDTITIAARSKDGVVTVFTKHAPTEILTAEDLRRFLRSYRSMLTAFSFPGSDADDFRTEPVFQTSVSTRNVIITSRTALLLQNSAEDTQSLLRLFSLNPDKLLSSHISANGTGSYVDQKGILYIRSSSFGYQAAQDGGIPFDSFAASDDSASLASYLRASLLLFESIRSLNIHFAGGDADIMLTSVETADNRISITFDYTFDNIRIADIQPAFAVTFENGMLVSAELYTLSVRNLGTRTDSVDEWWIEKQYTDLHKTAPLDITLVYPADFISESVCAQWRGEWASAEIPD